MAPKVTLLQIFESQISAVQSKVESFFNDKLDQLDSVVQSLSDRIDAINTQCEDNEKLLHENLENNCVALEKNLATVQVGFVACIVMRLWVRWLYLL